MVRLELDIDIAPPDPDSLLLPLKVTDELVKVVIEALLPLIIAPLVKVRVAAATVRLPLFILSLLLSKMFSPPKRKLPVPSISTVLLLYARKPLRKFIGLALACGLSLKTEYSVI
jgi:hypothetical protein